MSIESLQATLRDFAAARDWQPFHTPKNLAAALTVEAAELMEIFQWMTPEESIAAHTSKEIKRRIGEEIADVLLYLVQLADHTQIDIPDAVRGKLVRNGLKYPPTRPPANRRTPDATPEAQPVTHVLLDYENVQPSGEELRNLVPDATNVWVFHGPHQKQVESRFASFGLGMTAVPINKIGKNALDFHLSFYMGHIVSRNPQAKIVVVANDKGYDPMLEHVTAMGFAVRKVGHGPAAAKQRPSSARGIGATVPKVPAKKVAAKLPTAVKGAAGKKAAACKQIAGKKDGAKKAPAKKTTSPLKAKGQRVVATAAAPTGATGRPVSEGSTVSPAVMQRIIESLRKMNKRPTKLTSLRRALKPLLGLTASEDAINIALNRLIPMGIVVAASNGELDYPKFA